MNREIRNSAATVDPHGTVDPSSQIHHIQQVQDNMVHPHLQQNQQQQYIQTSAQYIQHPVAGQMPISSYYPIYAPPQQHGIHQQMDQQYPMYFLPVTQAQPYNLTMQTNVADATSVSTTRPLTPPNSAFVPSSTNYKEMMPPMYPAKTATPKPELPGNLYRTTATAAPTLVQVPPNQFQQQYYGLSQMPPQSQQIPASSTSTANYGYEYAHPTHDHPYYAQHPATPMPQYQSMTPAAAVLLSQGSSKLAAENTGQQISTSQP